MTFRCAWRWSGGSPSAADGGLAGASHRAPCRSGYVGEGAAGASRARAGQCPPRRSVVTLVLLPDVRRDLDRAVAGDGDRERGNVFWRKCPQLSVAESCTPSAMAVGRAPSARQRRTGSMLATAPSDRFDPSGSLRPVSEQVRRSSRVRMGRRSPASSGAYRSSSTRTNTSCLPPRSRATRGGCAEFTAATPPRRSSPPAR